MPIYEYGCQRCGKIIDVMQKISDPAPTKCESCGAEGAMQKLVSRTSFVLKGGGWYSDLYGSTRKGSTSTSESASSDTGKVSSTTSSSTPPAGSGGGSSGGSSSSGGTGGSGGSTGGGSEKK